jgi:hypothetical protein
MAPTWHFHELTPGRARESQVHKFFADAIDRAQPIVREGIQNSLDAGTGKASVRIRISMGKWTKAEFRKRWPHFADGFDPHHEAASRIEDRLSPVDDEFRYLVFEDFETIGLTGDPAEWKFDNVTPNAFFDFFRAEGVSHKGDGDRGRHGLGKFVFLGASQIRTLFGLTRRDDGRELLMGTAILVNHKVGKAHFLPDGWFGEPDPRKYGNVLPTEAPAQIARFKTEFGLARDRECGLSIVVPWLDPEITFVSLLEAVVEGYFLPLLRGGLSVELVDEDGGETRIDGKSLADIIESRGADFAARMQSRLDLAEAVCGDGPVLKLAMPPGIDTAPKWSPESIPPSAAATIRSAMASGEIVRLSCPTRVREKGQPAKPATFEIAVRREPGKVDCEFSFVREGIHVSGIKPRKEPGVRALIVIDKGSLADFLGDAENPAHTEWQSELVKTKYMFHRATIDYVVDAVRNILALTREDDAVADPLATIDLFHDAADDETAPKVKPKGKKGKPTPESKPALPPPKPSWYRLERIEGGFSLRPGPGRMPEQCRIEMAYDTAKGNPFKKYDANDFSLERRGDLLVESKGLLLHEYVRNQIVADLTDDDFELTVTGFDANRDVIARVRAMNAPTDDSEDDDAEAV